MSKELEEMLSRLRASKPQLAKDFKITRLAVFGSFARGEERAESDVDILVEVDPIIGLGFVSLAERLEQILGRKVDLVSHRAVKPSLWERIRPELIDA